MDIVLEFFDQFLFDPIYATVLPAKVPYFAPNATYSSLKETPTAFPTPAWEFKPASEYLSFEPTKYAYMSEWSRDNGWRQLTTLFLITWYVSQGSCDA
jgi:lathosterol oxidase